MIKLGAKQTTFGFAVLLLQACLAFAVQAQSREPAFDVAARLGRGINILGYDGLWQGHLNAPFRRENFADIRRAGFQHVRINLHTFQYMDDQDRLDPKVLRRLEWAFDRAIEAGLMVIVDEHDFTHCQAQIADCQRRLRSFWSTMSEHFAGKYPDVIFELLNEPGGNMTSAEWNDIQKGLIELIRVKHPHRTIIVAALNVDDKKSIYQLELPESDRNLIATVHYYEPYFFTHQGAPWALPGVRRALTDADKQQMQKHFELIAVWGAEERRPIYLGEFGVYEAAPPSDRVDYLSTITRLAERYGWPWAYWQFDHDFAAFDSKTQTWHADIVKALIPEQSKTVSPVSADRSAQ